MNRFFLRILFLFFLFISENSFAQKVFVANDFGNCGVGLRDSASGKWLAEPIYQYISYCGNGYYKLLLGSKEGVMDSTGKIVVPVIYDFIASQKCTVDSSSRVLFVINNGKYYGLVDEKNQVIVPMNCHEIIVAEDGSIITSKIKKRYSFYTIKGEETQIPGKLPAAPLPIGNHLYRVSRNAFGITYQRRYYNYHHGPRRFRHFFYRRHFRLKQEFGLMNDSLRLVVPKDYSRIFYEPGKYNLISVQKKNKTGYYNLQGKEIWAPVFRESYSYQYNYYTDFSARVAMINAVGYTVVKKKWRGNYGMIGANGDTILPFIYNDIYLLNSTGDNSSSLIWVVDKGTKGIYDPVNKKWILPMEYWGLNSWASYYVPDDSSGNKKNQFNRFNNSEYGEKKTVGMNVLVAEQNGKYGMLTTEGQEILPFIYDDYLFAYQSYFFRKDSSYISVSFPSYEDTSFLRNNYNGTRNIVSDCPASHRFEKVEKENGVTLFISSELIGSAKQKAIYGFHNSKIKSNPETYDSLIHATAIIIRPLTQSKIFPGIGPVYEFDNPNINYYSSEEKNIFCIDSNPDSYNRFQNITEIAVDSFHTYYSMSGNNKGIFREDGFTVLHPYDFHSAYLKGESNGLAFFGFDCGKNKTGIIDGNGKLLIQPVWSGLGELSGNYIWAKKKESRGYKTHYTWNILDTASHQLLLPKKLCSGQTYNFGKDAVLIKRKEGYKLYSFTSRKFILTGDVSDIFEMDAEGKYFAVRTCFGKIGIIDGNGKWIADTVWTALINATNDKPDLTGFSNTNSVRHGISLYNYCVLSNDTGWTIFNSFTGKISHDSESVNFLLNKSKNSFTIEQETGATEKNCLYCPSFEYAPDLKTQNYLAPWQENLLFDSLFSGERFIADSLHTWFIYPCADCYARNEAQYFQYTWGKNYDQEILNHTVEFVSDSCISVSRENISHYKYSKDRNPKDYFFTVMLFKDGPHNMMLDSLFTGTEWKKIISDEISLYLESHPGIEGNCHNPSMLPFVLKDRFVLTAKGIEFYPPNFKENGDQLAVLVPWEKLKPYLRKDVASKIFEN